MEKADRDDWWPRWVWVGECFFWYQLTLVVPDKFHRAIKWLCVCVCACVRVYVWCLWCVCQLTNMGHSLSRYGNELWIGDITGHLSLMDMTDGRYSLVQVHHRLMLASRPKFTCWFWCCMYVHTCLCIMWIICVSLPFLFAFFFFSFFSLPCLSFTIRSRSTPFPGQMS